MGEERHSGGQESPCSRYRRLGQRLDLAHRCVNAASKGIERSSYLRSAHGERWRHAYGRAAYQVDQDALIQTVLEDLTGKACVPEVESEQEPFTPHLRTGNLFRQAFERVLENSPLETYVFEK